MAEGFGVDVDTFPDIDDSGRAISGPRVVMVMALRRLTTPRGSLDYDRDFGFDLRDYLNEDLSAADLATLQQEIASELTKDERVDDCSASVTLLDGLLRIRISLTTTTGDMNFTLAITDVSAEILSESST